MTWDAMPEPPVALDPPVEGDWMWLSTRELRFVPRTSFAMATTYRVTTRLPDASVVSTDSINFSTTPPRILRHEFDVSHHQETSQRPKVALFFDQDVDPKDVVSRTVFEVPGSEGPRTIPARSTSSEWLIRNQRKSDSGHRRAVLEPVSPLPKDAQVTLVLGSGLPSLEGPRRTQTAQRVDFRTASPFRFLTPRTDSGPGRRIRAKERWDLPLSHPLGKDSHGSVAMSPGCRRYRIRDAALEISCAKPGIAAIHTRGFRDIFGQALETPSTEVEVLPAVPRLAWTEGDGRWLPGPLVALLPEQTLRLEADCEPACEVRVRVASAHPSFLPDYLGLRSDQEMSLARGATLWEHSARLGSSTGEGPSFGVNVPVTLGHYVLEAEVLGPQDLPLKRLRLWVQRTTLALRTFMGRTELSAWITDLASAEPVSDATVRLWPSGRTTTSNADGIVRFGLLEAGDDLLEVRHGQAHLLVPHQSWPHQDALGADIAENADGEHARKTREATLRRPYPGAAWARGPNADFQWYAATDRHLYQAGQSVAFFGWIRQREAGGHAQWKRFGNSLSVVWEAHDRHGRFALGRSALSAHSGFSGRLQLSENFPAGEVTLHFSLEKQDGDETLVLSRESESFVVAAYERPEFESELTMSQEPIIAGENMEMMMRATYLSGGGLSQARWRTTLKSHATWHPKLYEDFVFSTGRDVPPPPVARSHFKAVTRETVLDGKGMATAEYRLPGSGDPGHPELLVVESEVQDLNHREWKDFQYVHVHPSSLLVGVKVNRARLLPDESTSRGSLIVVDARGTPVEGREARLQLLKKSADDVGSQREHHGYQRISTTNVLARTTPVTIEAAHLTKGQYVWLAEVTDDKGRSHRSSATFEITSASPTRITSAEPSSKLYWQTDATSAHVAYESQSKFQRAMLVFERNGDVVAWQPIAASQAGFVSLPESAGNWGQITAELVTLGVTERGPSTEHTSSRRHLFETDNHHLAVGVSTSSSVRSHDTTHTPGERLELHMRVKFPDGRPAPGANVVVSVVDDALVKLSHRVQWTDPFEDFLGRGREPTPMQHQSTREVWPLSLHAWDHRSGQLREAASIQLREAASLEFRRELRPTAHFSAGHFTNADGQAKISFVLPDTPTRYRVMVAAAHGDRSFGLGGTSFTTSKPLAVRIGAPAFLRSGDHAEIPFVVQNQSGQGKTVSLRARAQDANGASVEVGGLARNDESLESGQRRAFTASLRAPSRATSIELRASVLSGRSLLDEVVHELDVIPTHFDDHVTSFGDGPGIHDASILWPSGENDDVHREESTQPRVSLAFSRGLALPTSGHLSLHAAMQQLCTPQVETTEALAAWVWAASSWLPRWDLVANACAPEPDDARSRIATFLSILAERQYGPDEFFAYGNRGQKASAREIDLIIAAARAARAAELSLPSSIASAIDEASKARPAEIAGTFQACRAAKVDDRECGRRLVAKHGASSLAFLYAGPALDAASRMLRDGEWRSGLRTEDLLAWLESPHLEPDVRAILARDLLSRATRGGYRGLDIGRRAIADGQRFCAGLFTSPNAGRCDKGSDRNTAD
ncbi:MAG: hypothetical protein KA712_12675 [Myxococcales bacterium]|nr:hypothetical protein [Myxococcales bacterium]